MRRFLFLALLIAATTSADQFQVDPAHSQVLFKVRHLGISTVTGEFKDFTASFELDPSNLASLKAEADIDAASVDTREADRDTHLKSADFSTSHPPRIRFTSRKAEVVSAAR
jgi:polyisoprenoid-binding protein YceI